MRAREQDNPGSTSVRNRQIHGTKASAGLERWFVGPLGETLLAKESEALFQGVRRLHGYTLLWMGPVAMPRLELSRCMVRNRAYCALSDDAASAHAFGSATVFRGQMEDLPVAPCTLDAVVVHHGFDCCDDPRSSIREIAKALRPGGRVLVCGFNPWSFWGLRRVFAALRGARLAPFVSPTRLVDWLAVLGFEVDEGVRFLMFRPPLVRFRFERSWLTRLRTALERWQPPIGGVYCVLARKSSAATLPLSEPRQARQPKLVVAALPGPTARNPQ